MIVHSTLLLFALIPGPLPEPTLYSNHLEGSASLAPALDDDLDPEEELEAIIAEFDAAQLEFRKAYREASTNEERRVVVEEKRIPAEAFADRVTAVAERNAGEPVAAEALMWIAERCRDTEVVAEAMKTLLADHLESEVMGRLAQSLARGVNADNQRTLELILEKSPHEDVRGHACYALASHLMAQAEKAHSFKGSGGEALVERYRGYWGDELVDRLLDADAEALEDRSASLFERVLAEHADLSGGRRTLGERAEGDLFELRNLAIGKTAPDIEGEDLDGVMFKLSDYRGKVVVLDFWGDW